MKVLVTAPTGNIGHVVAQKLLTSEASVAVFARDPAKVRDLAARGARIFQGSLESESDVAEATAGFDAVFWLTPPNSAAADVLAYQKLLGNNIAAAIRKNGIPRVVNLSSIGAQWKSGTGPIAGLHHVEKAIDGAAANVTHLRPGYFMENVLGSSETIRSAKSIFLPVAGAANVPVIATRDIGEFAAARLLDTSWNGRQVVELLGPEELSFDTMAATIGKVIGEPIRHVQVTAAQAREAMLGAGLGKNMVELYLEMFAAFDAGKVVAETPKAGRVTTKTSFDDFCRKAFGSVPKPARM